jgi:hypothetical protein
MEHFFCKKTTLIKNCIYIFSGLIAVLLAGYMINGCKYSGNKFTAANKLFQNSPDKTAAKEFKYFNNMYPLPDGIPIWEAQLSKFFNDSRFENSGLKLSGYRYLRDITTKQQLEGVKQTLIKENMSIPLYREDSSEFVLSKMLKSNDFKRRLLDKVMPTSKQQKTRVIVSKDGNTNSVTGYIFSDAVYIFKEDDAGFVELEWDYKGKKLKTLCIVSKSRGIIYDNFLYFISFSPEIIKNFNTEAGTQLPAKSSHNADISPDTPLTYSFSISGWNYNLYGQIVFYFTANGTLTGNMDAGNTKVIEDYSTKAHTEYAPGYKAVLDIHIISFEPGDDGHWEFAWVYAYGHDSSLSTGWNGTDFSISGEGTSESGEGYVKPGDLMPEK